MRKKIIKISFIVIFLLLITIFLGVTFLEERKYNERRKKIENIILNYLEGKYNEKFEIKEYAFEKNTYDHVTEDDYITSTMESSYIYTVSVVSSRLVEFDVMYVEYDGKKIGTLNFNGLKLRIIASDCIEIVNKSKAKQKRK